MASMSHELRTPLNAIIGFSEALLHELHGTLGSEANRHYIEDIHGAGKHLLDLINDVLDLSVIEAGKLELSERELDAAEAAAGVLRLVETRAQNHNIALSVRAADGRPRLYADERRLKQILLNLVNNSVKFTPDGGRVEIAVGVDEDGAMTIAVTDSGIGMNARDIEKALEPFGRVAGGRGPSEEGTGLGLPLTIQLIEAHGGRLSIDSAPGKGTTATVRFPPRRTRPVT
jgi:signal transduction histidine kinase